MAKAQTLLEMSGVFAKPKAFKDSVLVIIDAQNEYWPGKGSVPLTGIEAATANISLLLTEARKLSIPVIHIVHKGGAGGLFDSATARFQIIDALKPNLDRKGELVVEKSFPNSFQGTTFLKALDEWAQPSKQLVLTGFMTHMCISATARSALDHGLNNVVVISDATATRDLKGSLSEADIPASVVHETALAEIQDRAALLATTSGILAAQSS